MSGGNLNNECFQLAERNSNLARWLYECERDNYDWVVTILFYSALMYARTWLELKKLVPPRRHVSYMKSGKILSKGWDDTILEEFGNDANIEYSLLYNASRRCRYDPKEAMNMTKDTTTGYIKSFEKFRTAVVAKLTTLRAL